MHHVRQEKRKRLKQTTLDLYTSKRRRPRTETPEMSEDSDPDIQQFTSSSDEENLERELVKKKANMERNEEIKSSKENIKRNIDTITTESPQESTEGDDGLCETEKGVQLTKAQTENIEDKSRVETETASIEKGASKDEDKEKMEGEASEGKEIKEIKTNEDKDEEVKEGETSKGKDEEIMDSKVESSEDKDKEMMEGETSEGKNKEIKEVEASEGKEEEIKEVKTSEGKEIKEVETSEDKEEEGEHSEDKDKEMIELETSEDKDEEIKEGETSEDKEQEIKEGETSEDKDEEIMNSEGEHSEDKDKEMIELETSEDKDDEIKEGETSEDKEQEIKEGETEKVDRSALLLEEQYSEENDSVELGAEYDTLLRAPGCCAPLARLTPSLHHTVLFRVNHPSQPHPQTYRDKWDKHHVRMPCSPKNIYPDLGGEKKLVSRWEIMRESLSKPMASSYDLQEAINSYTRNYKFQLLHILTIEEMTPRDQKEFFEFTLPGIIRMALSLPEMCTKSLPLLKKQIEQTITMTQQQAACLLSCAFLCMFPRRKGQRNKNDEYNHFPIINFNRLFELDGNRLKKMEKLKCIIHYFKRVLQQPPCGTISFKRQILMPLELGIRFHLSKKRLCRLRVSNTGTIEDNAAGMLQVDFANRLVGGGVLSSGCVQEEIRFSICPELIVSRLLTEELDDNECLIVTGAERFSDYVGYAGTFKWAGDHVDQTPRDSWGRRHTQIVAIDAERQNNNAMQFSQPRIQREVVKAYVGFLSRDEDRDHLPAVATGKWGCGAFNGDPELKSLIQIMAASVARRDMLYFTFGDKEHAKELHQLHCLLKDKDITVGKLWEMIIKCKRIVTSDPPTSLFKYIQRNVEMNNDE